MLPAVADGAARAGRDASTLAVAMKPLVATAPNDELLSKKIRDVRARIAFYASTPAYRPAFEIWGLGDLTRHLSTLSREQRWEELPSAVDDEMLNTFAVVGRHDEIADKIVERFSGLLTDVGFSTTVENEDDLESLKAMVRRVQTG